jgi:hypothetical protein
MQPQIDFPFLLFQYYAEYSRNMCLMQSENYLRWGVYTKSQFLFESNRTPISYEAQIDVHKFYNIQLFIKKKTPLIWIFNFHSKYFWVGQTLNEMQGNRGFQV